MSLFFEKCVKLQKDLLSKIESKLIDKPLVVELMETLNISRSAAYKRIRCHTIMSMEECLKILFYYGFKVELPPPPEEKEPDK